MTNFKDTIDSFQEEIINIIQKCIQIKSITGDEKGVRNVLDFYLQLAQNMGFSTESIDNLGGVIHYGEGQKTFGIIVHLDTVPEGTGWQFSPYEGQIEDGKIYGRGAIDDKGPAIAALFALKAFKSHNPNPNCTFQIIIGIDEENVWNLTPKLLEKITEPDFSFVPDSTFPIVIAEKGLLWLEISKDFAQDTDALPVPDKKDDSSIIIKTMTGGSDYINIVPDYCEAILSLTSEKKAEVLKQLQSFVIETGYDLSCEENSHDLKLVSKGKSAHAFNCQEGQNAISQLMLFLNTLDIIQAQKNLICTHADQIGMETFGECLGLAREDKLTGKLTVSPGFISIDENKMLLKIDIRFPSDQDLSIITDQAIEALAVFGGQISVLDSLRSLCFAEDDPHVTKLLKVYKDFTGDSSATPLGMGGTTYAKAFERAVAFGPTFPGMAKVEHQPDEYMEIDHLLKCTEIYALALQALSQD